MWSYLHFADNKTVNPRICPTGRGCSSCFASSAQVGSVACIRPGFASHAVALGTFTNNLHYQTMSQYVKYNILIALTVLAQVPVPHAAMF